MQELLAIPDRNRTDSEWDELNELEIALASGNRPGAPDPQQQRRSMGVMSSGSGSGQPKMGGGRPQGKNLGGGGGGGKKFHKRPGKRRGGGGGGGGGGNGNVGGGGPQQPPQ